MAAVDDRSAVSVAPRGPAWRQRVETLLPPTPTGSGRQTLGYLVAFLAAVGFQLLTSAGRTHLTHIWAEGATDADARRLAQEYARRIRQMVR